VAEALALLRDLVLWLLNVVRHGVAVLAGAVITVTVFVVEHSSGTAFSWRSAEWIMGASVVTAFFLAWRSEHTGWISERRAHATTKDDLARELDKRPKLSPKVTTFIALPGRESNTWDVCADLNVENGGGTPSRVSEWEAFLLCGEPPLRGTPNPFGPGGIATAFGPVNLSQHGSIDFMSAVQPGEAHNAFIFTRFANVPDVVVTKDLLLVRVRDVKQQWTECFAKDAKVLS
jgi:hypothetical protein